MTKRVTLYFTDGCHLCDDALALIERLNLCYQKVDIIDSDRLVALYATRIPVVENESGLTLNWPFSLQQLQHFIEEN
ncbi:thioredoxin family protein [Psychromonas sp. psych-6C06]|uniref:glutaredoxin family protein n=1 Tax=Psychromonas sp. psych-6C06 TaxID=2058089 RepID=UPI000C337D3C|nr:glutaredoxin family protein [Psychromonas sp. psych-6C06]PKF63581.1 thioredoxin family protein [Psychromonas sp. psych-6C06]